MNTLSKPPAAPLVRRAVPWRAFMLVGLLVLNACSPQSPPPTATASADGWHEFQGSWTAAGNRRVIPLGDGRKAALVHLTGSLVLAGPSRPGVGFRAEVLALTDSATGLSGRAVWTDEKGEQVFSELRGEGTAAKNRIEGTFLGGTGRYAGATGSYEFSWQYVMETEDGAVQGRAPDVKGRVRAGGPPELPQQPQGSRK